MQGARLRVAAGPDALHIKLVVHAGTCVLACNMQKRAPVRSREQVPGMHAACLNAGVSSLVTQSR